MPLVTIGNIWPFSKKHSDGLKAGGLTAPYHSWLACHDSVCAHAMGRPQKTFDLTCLPTCWLQQDPLENFFGSVRRKGCNEHSNVCQFIAARKQIFDGKLFNLIARRSCEIQEHLILAKLAEESESVEAPTIEAAQFPSFFETSHESLPDILEHNALFCFSSHLAQQFLKSRDSLAN